MNSFLFEIHNTPQILCICINVVYNTSRPVEDNNNNNNNNNNSNNNTPIPGNIRLMSSGG